MSIDNKGGRFKYDICRVIGHENSLGFCDRCEFDLFAADLKDRLEAQFVGRKITSETIEHIRCTAREILFKQVDSGVIQDFRALRVDRPVNEPHHYLEVDALNSSGVWVRTCLQL